METDNKIRQRDLEELALSDIFDRLSGETIMVTGAAGLIGSEIVLGILCANRLRNLDIKVVASVRNKEKAQSVFKSVLSNPNFEIFVQDITEPVNYPGTIDYIIHCAANTSSLDFVEKPVETILTTVSGIRNILDFARKNLVKSTVYISSLEVYGNLKSDNFIKEEDYGVLDILNPRSSYPQSKRLAETLCASYFREYNTDVNIARLAQTCGAGILEDDRRVFAEFAKCALKGEDIVLHTKGETVRNYCYLSDAVSAILTILIKGNAPEAYNVANKTTGISIRDMAELLGGMYNINVEYAPDGKEHGYNPTVKICLDTEKTETLGWSANVGLKEMFQRTIDGLKGSF